MHQDPKWRAWRPRVNTMQSLVLVRDHYWRQPKIAVGVMSSWSAQWHQHQISDRGWALISCGCFRKPPHCLLTFCLRLPLSQLRDNSHFPHPHITEFTVPSSPSSSSSSCLQLFKAYLLPVPNWKKLCIFMVTAFRRDPRGKENCKAAHFLDLPSLSPCWLCATFPAQSLLDISYLRICTLRHPPQVRM